MIWFSIFFSQERDKSLSSISEMRVRSILPIQSDFKMVYPSKQKSLICISSKVERKVLLFIAVNRLYVQFFSAMVRMITFMYDIVVSKNKNIKNVKFIPLKHINDKIQNS